MQKNLYERLPENLKVIFLAGLFDGEGSFGVWGKGSGRKSFQCSVEMCDKDIIQRFVVKNGNKHGNGRCQVRGLSQQLEK